MSVEVKTFGCRLNQFESELIKKHAELANLNDVVIINSCAVTSEAERQLKQFIRKLKKEKPNCKVVVSGCAAQINPAKYSSMNEVFKVIGNKEKLELESYKQISDDIRFANDSNDSAFERVVVDDIADLKETAHYMADGFKGRARGFLQVQNGCDHRCTFCIIPYGRGNSRSVPIGEIVQQSRIFLDNGCKELVLTGVDITSYGHDLPGKPTLGEMMKRLLILLPDLKRLRLSSIDVAEIDDDLMDIIVNEKRFMPHLHLSLQSGDNMILKRMKRRHSRENVIDFCNRVRELRSDIVFGADIIAGFPTETEEMFHNTYSLIEDLKIIHLHVFPYSEREGTPASRMPQVKKEIRKERAAKLRELGDKLLSDHYLTLVNKELEVLMETENFGRSADFSLVKVHSDNNKIYEQGTVIRVLVKEFCSKSLISHEIF